jgi:hypothetical protein
MRSRGLFTALIGLGLYGLQVGYSFVVTELMGVPVEVRPVVKEQVAAAVSEPGDEASSSNIARPVENVRMAETHLAKAPWAAMAKCHLRTEDTFLYANEWEHLPKTGEVVFKPFAAVVTTIREGKQQVATLICDAALLKFQSSFDFKNPNPGRIIGGALRGEVTLAGPQGLSVSGRDFYFSESAGFIWSDRPVSFELGSHAGSARKLKMELVTSNSPISQGLPAIAGIRTLRMMRDVQMTITLKQKGKPLPLHIKTPGSFEYFVEEQIALFEPDQKGSEDVLVFRNTETGQQDWMRCEHLKVHFIEKELLNQPPSALRVANGPAKAKGPGGAAGMPVVKTDLEFHTLEATGKRVVLESPDNQLRAEVGSLDYNAETKQLRLAHPNAVIVRRRQEATFSELKVPKVSLQLGDDDSLLEARCDGAGYFENRDQKSRNTLYAASWGKYLSKVRDATFGLDRIELVGEASVRQPLKQTGLAAEKIQVWVTPIELSMPEPGQEKGGSKSTALRVEPRRMLAIGGVAFVNPGMESNTNSLEVLLEELRGPPAILEPISRDGRNGGSGVVVKEAGSGRVVRGGSRGGQSTARQASSGTRAISGKAGGRRLEAGGGSRGGSRFPDSQLVSGSGSGMLAGSWQAGACPTTTAGQASSGTRRLPVAPVGSGSEVLAGSWQAGACPTGSRRSAKDRSGLVATGVALASIDDDMAGGVVRPVAGGLQSGGGDVVQANGGNTIVPADVRFRMTANHLRIRMVPAERSELEGVAGENEQEPAPEIADVWAEGGFEMRQLGPAGPVSPGASQESGNILQISGSEGAKEAGGLELVISGENFHLQNRGGPLAPTKDSAASTQQILHVFGEPAHVRNGPMHIEGKAIHLDRDENRAWVEGAGLLQLPVNQSFDGKVLPQPESLDVWWEEGMSFDGELAGFDGNVRTTLKLPGANGAQQNRMRCESLTVTLDNKVSFTDVTKPKRSPAIVLVTCNDGVEFESHERKEGKLSSIRRGKVHEFQVNQQTGKVLAQGPGEIQVWERASGGSGEVQAPREASGANRPQRVESGTWDYRQIVFAGKMLGNIHQQTTTFDERVQIVFGPVTSATNTISIDAMPKLGGAMRCNLLEVVYVSGAEGKKRGKKPEGIRPGERKSSAKGFGNLTPGEGQGWVELVGSENAEIEGEDFNGRADQITFDQSKGLFTLRSIGNRKATIWRQADVSQPATRVEAQRMEFNPGSKTLNLTSVTGAEN